MNEQINGGGPAFSSPGILAHDADGNPQNPWSGFGWAQEPQPGMPLRVWLAATIPLATYEQDQITRLYVDGSIAEARQLEVDKRYMKADAMIAAQNK